jgi:hypothetical protein
MNKGILPAILVGCALLSSPALAAKNVASTSQKGSMLIFPAIDVDPAESDDTIVEMSNDQNASVQIECYYINEKKDRVNFDFILTAKQTASWSVGTGSGDQVNPPPFPSAGTFGTGDPARGELVCFATDSAVQNQIAWNHLTGTATVVHFASLTTTAPIIGDVDADQPLQAFRYNAWAFVAEAASGGAADRVIMGAPGTLALSGSGASTYDACPQYNIVNFMPGEGGTSGSGASLAGVYTIDNALTFVTCNQDLRQDFNLHLTKLQFTVWNSKEQSFSGSYACVDSVGKLGPDSRINVTNLSIFTRPTLGTDNARLQVQGVASTQCPASEAAGILGVFSSSVSLDGDFAEDAELGSTTLGAGAQAGFVKWDPFGSGGTPQAPSTH